MQPNRLRQIAELGQAVWIDNLHRQLLDDGQLERLINEDGLTGVTSNPTIFQKAIAGSNGYGDALQRLASEKLDPRQAFFELAYQDIRDAADLLQGVWGRTDGQDGYVSFELPPDLAYDASGSIAAAPRFREAIDRENVLVKVPGSEQGVEAFEELTARGQSINVTLLFAVPRYEEIAEAYLRGLERRHHRGEPIDRITSVASFFVSRVDAKIDPLLDELGRHDLQGAAAIANAKIAYAAFRRIFSGRRWQALREHGANVQRPLWASTSTKNPAYSDTHYIDALIGPDTVNTMNDRTLAAARDHAHVTTNALDDTQNAHEVIAELRTLGIPVDDIVLRQLVDEGVEAFAESFDTAVETVGSKMADIIPPGR